MPRYVALLRGINVGRAKRIAMADLRALLAEFGCTDVRTVLNSGNAVLTAEDDDPDALAARISDGLRARTGFEVPCAVLTAEQVRAIVDGDPFADVATDGSRMMAHVLGADPDPALLAEHDPVVLDPERTRVGDRVVYQWCPDGLMAAPDVGGYLHEHLGVLVTTRNRNTMVRLRDLL